VGGWVKADVRLSVSCKPNHLGIERGSAALLVPIPHIDEVCFIVLIYIYREIYIYIYIYIYMCVCVCVCICGWVGGWVVDG